MAITAIESNEVPVLKSSRKGRPEDANAATMKAEILGLLRDRNGKPNTGKDGKPVRVKVPAGDLSAIGAKGNTLDSQIGTLKRAFKRDNENVKVDRTLDDSAVIFSLKS